MTQTKPRPVPTGGTLGLVSPSSAISAESLEPGLAYLQAQGYRIKRFPSLYAKHHELAGTDEARAADLKAAFEDPDVDAVLCSRGGYGCARLIPHLDFEALASHRKLFIGYSDITTLHLAFQNVGFATLHGAVGVTFSKPREPWVWESFGNALTGDLIRPKDAPVGETVRPGRAEGEVIGGCLRLICDALGTPDAPDTDGKILLIEDTGEKAYRVDAMLTQLLNAGLLQRSAGIVIGEFSETDALSERGDSPCWRSIVEERLGKIRVPTIVDYPIGHKAQILSVGLGVRAVLDADRGTLDYSEPLCE